MGPHQLAIVSKSPLYSEMVTKLKTFSEYLTKLQHYEKRTLFQISDRIYELGTIGEGEIVGLDIMLSSEKISLFTYEIVSERFSYITVPKVAIQLLFNPQIVNSTLGFLMSVLQYRMEGLIKKFNTSNLRLEDGRFELRDGSLTQVEQNVRQLQMRDVQEVELEMLAAKIQDPKPVQLATARTRKVITLLETEQKYALAPLPHTTGRKPWLLRSES